MSAARSLDNGALSYAAAARLRGWPRGRMKVCEITLNFDCNAKCVFCYSEPGLEKKEGARRMDLRLVWDRLVSSYRNGARMVQFIGGEPTVYRELPQALRLARRAGYPAVQMVTNGLRLSDRRYAELLARAGLDTAAVSLHGPRAAVHDAVVGVKGAFARTVRAIENLLGLGVYVTTGTAVTALNYRELPALTDLAFGRFGLDSCHLIAAHYIGWAGKNRDRLRVAYSEIAPFVMEAASAPARYGRRPPFPFLSNFLPCVLPGYERVMGDWKLPEQDDDLHLPGESHEGRMYAMITEKLRMKKPSCRRCVYGRVCAGFEKGYNEIYGGREFRPLERRPSPLAPAPLLK